MKLSATHAFYCIVLMVKFGWISCEDILPGLPANIVFWLKKKTKSYKTHIKSFSYPYVKSDTRILPVYSLDLKIVKQIIIISILLLLYKN